MINPRARQVSLAIGDVILLAALLSPQAAAGIAGIGVESNWREAAIVGRDIALSMAALLLTFYLFDLYDVRQRTTKRWLVRALVAAIVGVGGVEFLARIGWVRQDLMRAWLFIPGYTVGAAAWRGWFGRFLWTRGPQCRIAVIGEGVVCRMACELASEFPHLGLDVVATWESDGMSGGPEAQAPPQSSDSIVEECDRKQVELMVHSGTTSLCERIASVLRQAGRNGIEVMDAPTFMGQYSGRIPVETIDRLWVERELVGENRLGLAWSLRRMLERVAAAILMIGAAPIWLLIAVAIRIDSPGPVLFGQERLGLYKRPFRLYKFRTMVRDAENETGPIWTYGGDPRVTRVGRLLRRTGLDELPQLINILKGDMQFVGHRPIREHFARLLADSIPFYDLRFSIMPGLTGWAQVQHDYAGSVAGQRMKFAYELYYLRNSGALLDLQILVKTVRKVMLGRVNDVTGARAPRSGSTAARTSVDRTGDVTAPAWRN